MNAKMQLSLAFRITNRIKLNLRLSIFTYNINTNVIIEPREDEKKWSNDSQVPLFFYPFLSSVLSAFDALQDPFTTLFKVLQYKYIGYERENERFCINARVFNIQPGTLKRDPYIKRFDIFYALNLSCLFIRASDVYWWKFISKSGVDIFILLYTPPGVWVLLVFVAFWLSSATIVAISIDVDVKFKYKICQFISIQIILTSFTEYSYKSYDDSMWEGHEYSNETEKSKLLNCWH